MRKKERGILCLREQERGKEREIVSERECVWERDKDRASERERETCVYTGGKISANICIEPSSLTHKRNLTKLLFLFFFSA